MRIDIMTLFSGMFEYVLGQSIIGKARREGLFTLEFHNIRDFTLNKQAQVDDYPYGGGKGMVMQADPLYRCLEHVKGQGGGDVHVILMSPQGQVFIQEDAKRLARMDRVCIVCGHYEGVDQRFIDQYVDEEISIGDYVLTGGEIPAMAVCDSVLRLLPGVLADECCYTDESHWDGLLEHPHYSRPAVWQGMAVPGALTSGNHEEIAKWRRARSLIKTALQRPDMLKKARLERDDLIILAEAGEKETYAP